MDHTDQPPHPFFLMRQLIKFIVPALLGLVLFSTAAQAQDRLDNAAMNEAIKAEKDSGDKPTEAPGSIFLGLKGVATQLGKTLGVGSESSLSNQLFTQGKKVALTTVSWAKGLAASLALMYFVVECFAFISGKNSSLRASVVEIAIPLGFCSYLLANYPNLIEEFCGEKGLLAYVRSIGGDPIQELMKFYGQLLTTVVTSIEKAGQGYLNEWASWAPLSTLNALVDLVITILFALGVAAVALMGLAETLGLILMGPFLTAIGVALGPIFIACIVTPWTREYFTRWLGFIVSASLLTTIIGLSMSIAITLFNSFGFDQFANRDTPTAMTMLVILIILATVNALISQAPAIASALVPGSTGASKGGGRSLGTAAKSMLNRASNQASGVKKLLSKSRG